MNIPLDSLFITIIYVDRLLSVVDKPGYHRPLLSEQIFLATYLSLCTRCPHTSDTGHKHNVPQTTVLANDTYQIEGGSKSILRRQHCPLTS